jgi:Resolvase, N terminal domain
MEVLDDKRSISRPEQANNRRGDRYRSGRTRRRGFAWPSLGGVRAPEHGGTGPDGDKLAQARTIAGWHGLAIDDEAVFVDIASGDDADRRGLAPLRTAVRSGIFVGVVVTDLAKLSRDPAHLNEIIQEFRQHHVRLVHAGSPIAA